MIIKNNLEAEVTITLYYTELINLLQLHGLNETWANSHCSHERLWVESNDKV